MSTQSMSLPIVRQRLTAISGKVEKSNHYGLEKAYLQLQTFELEPCPLVIAGQFQEIFCFVAAARTALSTRRIENIKEILAAALRLTGELGATA